VTLVASLSDPVPNHLATTAQNWMVAQHHQVRDRLSTIGQHHGQIDQHPAAIPAP
jgi:hypothetical protein